MGSLRFSLAPRLPTLRALNFLFFPLAEVAWDNDVALEGVCDQAMACSTCHVVLDNKTYEAVPGATEDELDVLDLAAEQEGTSRLACQVMVSPALEGAQIKVPQHHTSLLDE